MGLQQSQQHQPQHNYFYAVELAGAGPKLGVKLDTILSVLDRFVSGKGTAQIKSCREALSKARLQDLPRLGQQVKRLVNRLQNTDEGWRMMFRFSLVRKQPQYLMRCAEAQLCNSFDFQRPQFFKMRGGGLHRLREGRKAWQDLLGTTSNQVGLFKWSMNLSLVAMGLAQNADNRVSTQLLQVIKENGLQIKGRVSAHLSTATKPDVGEALLEWLVDEGFPDRPNRRRLLDPRVSSVGFFNSERHVCLVLADLAFD